MHLVVRDETSVKLWELEEQRSGGLIWFTKFRTALALTIRMNGLLGEYFIRRPAGLFRTSYDVQDGRGEAFFRIVQGWRCWSLLNRDGSVLGEARFTNPTVLGDDSGVLKSKTGVMVEMRLISLGFLSSRWRCEIRFLAKRELWEIPAVALTAIRLAVKQGR